MDKTASRERTIDQLLSDRAPSGWNEAQDSLAAAAGLSILLVEGRQPPALAISNNNSICHALQSSPAHVTKCDEYCGKAFERAQKAGGVTHYQCHAGLHCTAMPVQIEDRKKLAVIGGRAFLTSAAYRALAERFRVGDLQDALSTDIFTNVIFAGREDLDDLAVRVVDAIAEFKQQPAGAKRSATRAAPADEKLESEKTVPAAVPVRTESSGGEIHVLKDFASKHKLESIALLMHGIEKFETVYASGRFTSSPITLRMKDEDARMLDAFKRGTSLSVVENQESVENAAASGRDKAKTSKSILELFPLVVGSEVRGTLLVGDSKLSNDERRVVAEFCSQLAMSFELQRLREELGRRSQIAESLQGFATRISNVDPSEVYLAILRHSAELLNAERSSLLMFDENSNELAVKAAVGPRASVISDERIRLGEGVSGSVLEKGQPLVVRDVEMSGRRPAPMDRRYASKSFICYPIVVGDRKIGVINVTDKAGGGVYDEFDLYLLERIAPQITLALDRAEWQERAAEFELMSITDPLTGLLNRRYLEERLAEELKRSERHNYAMGFLMIDIDDFKLYNDHNGHPAGDLALEMTAQCLKATLRGADVASRYGGEEFCILLPQTTTEEVEAIAERIRLRVESTSFPHGRTQPLGKVTVSIGVSFFSETLNTPGLIISEADRALYRAKALGKNRVQVLDRDAG